MTHSTDDRSTPAVRPRSRPGWQAWVTSMLCAVLALSPVARADSAVAAPPAIRAAIATKALLHLRGSTTARMRLALVSGGNDAAAADVVAMATAWQKLGGLSGVGTIELKLFNSSAGAMVTQALAEFAPHVVYIPFGADVAAHSRLAGNLPAIIMCGDPAFIRAGCSLAIEVIGRRPRIVLFPAASQRRGIKWAPELVQLARVVQ